MALKTEPEEAATNAEGTLSIQKLHNPRLGEWRSFPFLTGSNVGMVLATSGVVSNLIVYLIREFNVKNIQATQIANVVSGSMNLSPIAGAIIADSFLGCFSVIFISALVSSLGIVLLTLTATVNSMRPPSCTRGSEACEPPSTMQFGVLYAGLALVAIGNGGTRFTMLTMGANQFNKAKDQQIFIDWFFFFMYSSSVIALTAIVYTQDNVGWEWGFGICAAANTVGLLVFLLGKGYYRLVKPQGSPFAGLARVAIAAILKWRIQPSTNSGDYFHGDGGELSKLPVPVPSNGVSFLNRAALKSQGDTNNDGSLAKPWRLCTVNQVEDLKTLLKIIPLWSTGILLSTSIGIQASLTILQVLTMDRHLGPDFSIPPSSFPVSTLITTAVALSLFDRFLYPACRNLAHRTPTPLKRIGVGHVINIVGMAVSAIIETRRLAVVHSHHLAGSPNAIVPMSGLWLLPQLVLVGIGEAFHFPGQANFYYQEFPVSLRSTATGAIALLVGIGFYLSTATVDVVRKTTGWLPDNVNDARVDNVYWMLSIMGALNFSYYLVCSKLYRYKSGEEVEGSLSEA